VLIDWQLVQRVPGVRDLSYLVGTSVAAAERAEVERALLARYVDSLERLHVRGYGAGRLLEDYRRSVICDFGRMVMTAGQAGVSREMEAVVEHQLACRAGSTEELGLMDLVG
jgi:hypothetical protein